MRDQLRLLSPSLLQLERAPVLAGVNVVRPVGRSTLTPAPVRRAPTQTRGGFSERDRNEDNNRLTRPDPMSDRAIVVKRLRWYAALRQCLGFVLAGARR